MNEEYINEQQGTTEQNMQQAYAASQQYDAQQAYGTPQQYDGQQEYGTPQPVQPPIGAQQNLQPNMQQPVQQSYAGQYGAQQSSDMQQYGQQSYQPVMQYTPENIYTQPYQQQSNQQDSQQTAPVKKSRKGLIIGICAAVAVIIAAIIAVPVIFLRRSSGVSPAVRMGDIAEAYFDAINSGDAESFRSYIYSGTDNIDAVIQDMSQDIEELSEYDYTLYTGTSELEYDYVYGDDAKAILQEDYLYSLSTEEIGYVVIVVNYTANVNGEVLSGTHKYKFTGFERYGSWYYLDMEFLGEY